MYRVKVIGRLVFRTCETWADVLAMLNEYKQALMVHNRVDGTIVRLDYNGR